MKKILLGVSFAVVSLMLTACKDTTVINGSVEQRTNAVQMNEVVFVDHDLNRVEKKSSSDKTAQTIRVSVNSKGIRSTATGTAEVWVVLRNHTDYPQQIEGRTMFFDNDQAPADAAPQWKRVYIPANSLATYKELSISPQVAFYRVEIKGAE